jgi:hypothetical protein
MNRCDVKSGSSVCTNPVKSGECEFWKRSIRHERAVCAFCANMRCHCVAAIRAAIEAERVADGSKTMEEEWMKKQHSDCKHFALDNKEEPCASCWERSKWDPK